MELDLIQKGLGTSMIQQLKNAEKDVKKNKKFVANIHLEIIEKLLHSFRGKKIFLHEDAYQILNYDIEQLESSI